MAGGYGGQLIALDAQPFDLASPLADAAKITAARQENSLESQLAPLQIQQRQNDVATSQLALQLKQAQSPGDILAAQSALIAQTAAQIDPNDRDADKKWDAAMQGILDKGTPGAKQLIGRYNPALRQRIVAGYSAQSPLAAAAGMDSEGISQLAGIGTGGAPGGGGGQSSGGQPQDLNRLFNGMAPEQVQAVAQKVDAIKQAVLKVQNSQNPSAEWDAQAQALGHPDWVGHYSPTQLQKLYADTAQMDDYLKGRVALGGAGVPAPLVPQQVQEAGGALYAIDPYASGGATAKALTPRTQAVIGADGMPAVIDLRSGNIVGAGGNGAEADAGSLAPFAARMEAIENATGNPGARNPKSSATGNGQFIDDTWLRMVKANKPDLAEGKTDAQVLAMRSDPALSREMTAAYAASNAQKLSEAGEPVTYATLALAHRFGPDGAQTILAADPKTPLSQILSKKVLDANPGLAKETAGSYVSDLASKVGNDTVVLPSQRANLTGDAYLATIPPAMASQVKQIIDGRIAPPSTSSRSPQAQALLRAAAQYDPSGDYTTWTARNKMRASLASSTPSSLGGQLNSQNTAIGHLGTLYDDIGALNNSRFDLLNPALNWEKQHFGTPEQQTAVKNYHTSALAVATELPKALRGAGVAESDIKAWQATFNPNDAPVAQKAAIKNAVDLLDSRREPLTQQWQNVMGQDTDPLAATYPRAAQVLARLRGETSAAPGGPAQPTGGPPPAAQRVVGQVYQSPKGPVKWTGQGWELASAAQ